MTEILPDMILAAVKAATALALVVTLTRWVGLRTFSKMSSFDFAVTLALGSALASTATAGTWVEFWVGMATLAALFALQAMLTWARLRSDRVRSGVDNAPLLLVENGRILQDNLDRGDVARADLMAKLREANAMQLADVHAVVLETTGDVSVLHGGAPPDPELFEGVRR